MCAKEEKKEPTIKTCEDKGVKVDYFKYEGGEAYFFRTEEFKGITIGAVKIGWTNKYATFVPFVPQKISQGTLDVMAANASAVSGNVISSNDFVVISDDKGAPPLGKKSKEEKE